MNTTGVSIALLAISLILLIIYGVDVLIGFASATEDNQGFLPFNEMIRGSIFGALPVALSIIGFFISRKERSNPVAILLIVNGVLILMGMIIIISSAQNTTVQSEIPRTIAVTSILGAVLIGLGVWKFYINRKRIT